MSQKNQQQSKVKQASSDFEDDDLLGEEPKKATPKKTTPSKKQATPEKEEAPKEKAPEPKKTESKQDAAVVVAQNGSTLLPKPEERNFFHVKLEKTRFHPKTGQRLSKPYIQKFGINAWDQFKKSSEGLGFDTTEVKWDPVAYREALK